MSCTVSQYFDRYPNKIQQSVSGKCYNEYGVKQAKRLKKQKIQDSFEQKNMDMV
jgi:hypothetical protein